MELVTIPSQHGDIKLRAVELNAILQPNYGDGRGAVWSGPGSEILNEAIERGWFFWPKCIDRIKLMGEALTATAPKGQARIQAGFPHPACGIEGKDAIAFQAKEWPEAKRQTMIPSICCFAFDAAPGARITGRLLVEIQ